MSDKKPELDSKPTTSEPLSADALEQVAGGLGDTGTHEIGHITAKKTPKMAQQNGWEPGTLK